MIQRPGWRPVLLGVGAAVLTALLLALGSWQLARRSWKHALVAQVEARLAAAPVPAPPPAEWPGIGAADAYRRVVAQGRFENDKETLVLAATELGSGYWVITPLRTPAFTVLVNRGFVDPEHRARGTRPEQDTSAPVRVTGLLRVTEPGGGFLRTNQPAADRWYSRDVAAIAAARGLGPVAPYFIDADTGTGAGAGAGAGPRQDGAPVGGLTVVRFVDNHLVYALTWFGLALACPVGAWLALRRPGQAAGGAARCP